MIQLNGKKFASSKQEMTESLFSSGGTCDGYYRVNKKSVSIFRPDGLKIAVINRYGVLCRATKIDGKWWYSHGDPEIIGKYESYKQQCEECEQAFKLTGCHVMSSV